MFRTTSLILSRQHYQAARRAFMMKAQPKGADRWSRAKSVTANAQRLEDRESCKRKKVKQSQQTSLELKLTGQPPDALPAWTTKQLGRKWKPRTANQR